MKTESENIKAVEFNKIELGGSFYLSNPIALDEKSAYIKIMSKKNVDGTWTNAKTKFGVLTFVQYDKRVWIK